MNTFSATWRNGAASLVALGLIGGAYLFATNAENPPLAEASTETALLQAIATKDSTGDGIPDWEKTLYGIPVNASSTDFFHLGMTDGEAVAKGLIVPRAVANIAAPTSTPAAQVTGFDYAAAGITPPESGTLTDQFASNFFSLYLTQKELNGGADLSETDLQNIQDEAMSSLNSSIAPSPDFKSAKDLTVSGSGSAALTTFAANAEIVFKKNASTATTSEITYLQSAVENNDTTALAQLAAISKADQMTAAGLAVLPVPQELAGAHLELVNALMRVGQIVNDFTRVNTDPLTTMLALEQYQTATQALTRAFADVSSVYATAEVHIPVGTPGAVFIRVGTHTP